MLHLPFSHVKNKRAILLSLVAVAVVFFIVRQAIDIVNIRENPYGNRRAVTRYVSSYSPHTIPAAFFIFKTGSRGYLHEIREAAYADTTAGTPWMRYLLKKDIARVPPKERKTYLARYPFSLKHITKEAGEALIAGNPASYLNVTIVKRLLLEGVSADALSGWFKAMQAPEIKPYEVSKFMPMLMATQQDVRPILVRLFTDFPDYCYHELDKDEREAVGALISENPFTLDVLGYIQTAYAERDALTFGENICFLDILTLSKHEAVLARLEQLYAAYIAKGELTRPFWIAKDIEKDSAGYQHIKALIETVFTVTEARDENAAIAYFRRVARFDTALAEELAKRVLAMPDSTYRKNIIIHLVRRKSDLGYAHVDDIFVGEHPPTETFVRPHDYLGSAATEAYITLADHDYLETGKSWPPHVLASADRTPEEMTDLAVRYRDFIDRYPWFPGTDDAYYILASIHYLSGDRAAARDVIAEFELKKPLMIDHDADVFIDGIARCVAQEEEECVIEYKQAQE